MRILGFSKHWDKLNQESFTTFRFFRKDKDWALGEIVQIVIKPRSKNRVVLGTAQIVKGDLRKLDTIFVQYRPTEAEARADGFENLQAMNEWFRDIYGSRIFVEPINKFTLKWVSREIPVIRPER